MPANNRGAASQQAMLREFVAFVREASRLRTVVFFFDDVHWADLSTVDLLAHLGRNLQGSRVLVIVTYRHTEMLTGPHPVLGREARNARAWRLHGAFASAADARRRQALSRAHIRRPRVSRRLRRRDLLAH